MKAYFSHCFTIWRVEALAFISQWFILQVLIPRTFQLGGNVTAPEVCQQVVWLISIIDEDGLLDLLNLDNEVAGMNEGDGVA
jgi:hypothetical protein